MAFEVRETRQNACSASAAGGESPATKTTSPIPERLTEAEWRDREMLRQHWAAFCDADAVPEDFTDRMEVAGFISIRAVKKRDVEQTSFAAERGIEIGGMLWELTKKGLEVYGR